MRRFAMVKKDGARYSVQIKDATDFRRWPYREDHRWYDTRAEAQAALQQKGLIPVKAWHEARLTPAEEKASGY